MKYPFFIVIIICVRFLSFVKSSSDDLPPERILIQICLKKHVSNIPLNRVVHWFDDACHRYRCVVKNGRYNITAVSCMKPNIPPNATKCYEQISPNPNMMFPFCCTKLKCIIIKNGKKYIRVTGQLSENIPDEPYTDDEEFEFSIMSAQEVESSREDENKLKMIVQGNLEPEIKQPETTQHKSFFSWLLWPLTAGLFSESEVMRVFKSRFESYNEYVHFKSNDPQR